MGHSYPTTKLADCNCQPHPNVRKHFAELHRTPTRPHLGRDGNAGLGVRLQLSAASQQSLALAVCLAKLPAVEGVEGSTICKGVQIDLRVEPTHT